MKIILTHLNKLSFFLFTLVSASLYSQAPGPILRLFMNTSNFNDETVLYFQKGGTTSFQSDFDAYKLVSNAAANPYIGSLSDSILTSISGLPELPVTLSVPIKAITPVTKTFTFTTDVSEFNSFVCVTLFDAFTGISTNILNNPYVCTLYDTTCIARFTLNFYTSPLNVTTKLQQANCQQTTGKISFLSAETGTFNYEWIKNDSLIKTGTSQVCLDSLDNLTNGIYSLKINQSGTCNYTSATFTIDSVIHTVCDFRYSSSSNIGQISFSNKSANSALNKWDFGDNSGISNAPNPIHNYSGPGFYSVTLISESSSGCLDTASKIIQISEHLVTGTVTVTGISTHDKNNQILLATHSHGNYEIKFSFDSSENVEIRLIDMKGATLQKISLTEVSSLNQAISLDSFSSGLYFLSISTGINKPTTFKLIK